MPTWGYGLIAVAIAIWIAVYAIWQNARVRKMAASRPGENFESFRASFGTDAVPEDILLAVHAKFQGWWSGHVDGFPVRADDRLRDIYGMVGEDLEDAISAVLAECHRRLPPDNPKLYPVILDTVRDFALFIEACPMRDSLP